MRAFWERGYEATSMTDLTRAMHMNRGSIYQAFGDKHALFVAALSRYLDENYRAFKSWLAPAGDPVAALEHLFENVLSRHAGSAGCRGCFATNSLVELGPCDAEVERLLARQSRRLCALFAEKMAEGQALGTVRDDVSAEALARQCVIFLGGLMSEARGRDRLAILESAVPVFLTLVRAGNGSG